METTTTSAQTVEIAEVTEHICSYSEQQVCIAYGVENIKMLTDLFPIIPHFLNMTVDW